MVPSHATPIHQPLRDTSARRRSSPKRLAESCRLWRSRLGDGPIHGLYKQTMDSMRWYFTGEFMGNLIVNGGYKPTIIYGQG